MEKNQFLHLEDKVFLKVRIMLDTTHFHFCPLVTLTKKKIEIIWIDLREKYSIKK